MYRHDDSSPIEPKPGFVFDEFKQGFIVALCIVGIVVIVTMPFWAQCLRECIK